MSSSARSSASRRGFIRTLAAGAGLAVVGFDLKTRSWVTTAHAQDGDAFARLPQLAGEIVEDPAILETYAEDFGHGAHRVPRVVLKPASADDVVAIVLFANENGIKVAMRGQGHGQQGNGLIEAGVLIDSSTLNSVALSGETIVAGGGALWGDVVDTALAAGLTPPVMVDAMGLTVGGVLVGSGGFAFASPRYGLQADNVTELDVVTGAGEQVRCSKSERADLFDAMLIGQGQCGLIVSATLALIPAPSAVRIFTLTYADLPTCTADAALLVREDRFTMLAIGMAPAAGGGYGYTITAGAHVTPPDEPDAEALLAGLKFTATSNVDVPYPAMVHRLDAAIAALKASPGWTLPHPWFAMMLPASKVDGFVEQLLATPAELAGVSPFLPPGLLPLARSRLAAPLACPPEEDVCFSLSLLRTAQPGDLDAQLAANRALYERARDLGGKRAVWGAIPFTPADWADHYGAVWPQFQAAKQAYDPRNVLTPGPGVFTA